MGAVAALGAAAAAASIGSSISNIVGGPDGSSGGGGGFSGGSSPPPTYIPQNQSGADASYYSLVNAMVPYGASIPNYVLPQAQAATSNLAANPFLTGYQNAANTAGAYGAGTVAPGQQQGAATLQGLANQSAPYAGNILQSANASIPAANQILQTGFDPQNALYNRTAQQLTDQTNAVNSMYGLSSSPYGAGVAAHNLENFNIDWQNQQLQRQTQAAQGYTGLLGGAAGAYGSALSDVGRGFAGAGDLGTQAAGTISASGQLPYSTYMGGQNDILSALNNYSNTGTSAFGVDQNTLNALAAYLKLGQSATSIGQAGAAQNFGNNQSIGQGLGQGLSQLAGPLSSLFNSPSTSPYDTPGYGGGVSAGVYPDQSNLQSYPDYGYSQIYSGG